MLNLIKYEMKGRSKFMLGFLLLFALEHIYVVGLKVSQMSMDNVDAILMNGTLSTTVLIVVSFMFSLLDYSKHLNPKPGYMIFMANINRRSYILSKFITIFLETFLMGLLAIALIAFEVKYFDSNSSIHFVLEFGGLTSHEIKFFLTHVLKIIFYATVIYLMMVSISMLSITLRSFLFKNRSLGGFITFLISLGILFVRGYVYNFLNISFSQTFTSPERINTISSVSNITIVADFVFVLLLISTLIYLVEKKLNI